jgi:tRNA (guanine-N7-)-methyltransferase
MTAHKPGDPTTLNRLYGRAKGKPLRVAQQGLVDTLLPRIAVPAEGPVTAERLFGDDRPLHFEIGFGGGEHMAFRADLLPDHGFIGCEPFLNGVAQALTHVDGGRHGGAGARGQHPALGNVRIHHGDALEALRRVPDGVLSFVYLLHPDPWPKARHAKRRMINDGPLRLIAAKLKPGGEFRFGTDHPVYLRHALMVMRRHRHTFTWLCETPGDFQQRPGGWPETRYEAKARAQGHEVWYFRYRRI